MPVRPGAALWQCSRALSTSVCERIVAGGRTGRVLPVGDIPARCCAQVSSFGSLPRAQSSSSVGGRSTAGGEPGPSMSKVESIASTAVRAADKIQARLPLTRRSREL